jgi:hypothetical protein
MEKEDSTDPEARDASNARFWDKLHDTFISTLELVREEAKARGIDLDDPQLKAETEEHLRRERRLSAKDRPLEKAAKAYVKTTDKWFEQATEVFRAKGLELETLARLEVGHPDGQLAELSEFVDVIRWYQLFIAVKINRAIFSKASEELEPEELPEYPKDSEGSAKIALIAIDRSIEAWSGMRVALGESDETDRALDLLAQLVALRRDTEKLFPGARAFIRPGFDQQPTSKKQNRK